MPNLDAVYDSVRAEVADLLSGLSEEEANKDVPATPGWRIRDIASHLAGDAACVIVGDFPSVFFEALGDEQAVKTLNVWTSGHIEQRANRTMAEILAEWDESAKTVSSMMRGDTPWPENVPWFADRVLLTDLAVHQQDIFGALGIEKERESAQIKIAVSGYVATMAMRIGAAGAPALEIRSGDKTWTVGGDEPSATVEASRFELFRALSGRRDPDQIRAFKWEGDPEPFIPYFYLYGMRDEALVE
jgi:uncharacterized protein (TIGR03083 family)